MGEKVVTIAELTPEKCEELAELCANPAPTDNPCASFHDLDPMTNTCRNCGKTSTEIAFEVWGERLAHG